MGFETPAATLGDFFKLHQSQLKRFNSARHNPEKLLSQLERNIHG